MAAGGLAQTLRTQYDAESERIRLDFAAAGDGRLAIRRRTVLVDSLAARLWQEYVSPEPAAPATAEQLFRQRLGDPVARRRRGRARRAARSDRHRQRALERDRRLR